MYNIHNDFLLSLLKYNHNLDDLLNNITNKPIHRCILKFNPQEHIITQGMPIDYIYFLLNGVVSIYNTVSWAQESAFDFVEPPHILGLVELLNSIDTYSAHVTAETRCMVYKIPALQFDSLLKTNSEICYYVLKNLGLTTLLNMNNYQLKTIVEPVDVLGYHLYQNARTTPYTYPYTRENLADSLHINLRSLHRYIDILKKNGYLSIINGKIVITKQNLSKLSQKYLEPL